MEEVGGMVVNRGGSDELIHLPPGYRFHPTDEEIITSYLTEKVINSSFVAIAIGEADLNKCEPWDLPQKAKMGEKEWYFFCQRDRKYPTGMRTNRATESGYWKATGKDKEIFNNKGKAGSCLVGMKKTLVFYRGRAPKGEKTNWVMHEYRLEGKIPQYNNLSKAAKDEWVVCRVFHKNMGLKKTITPISRINSFGDHDLLDYSSLPPLMDPTNMNMHNSNFNMTNKPSGYGDHGFKPGANLVAPPPPSAKTSDHDHHAISNYLSYFSIGGSGGQGGLKQNHNYHPQLPSSNCMINSAHYNNTNYQANPMLFPQHHQFPNPANFSFQPNPNNSDYFQQAIRGSSASNSILNNQGFMYRTSTTDDDQAIEKAIAAAANNNNMNETSSSAGRPAGFGSSGLERQCKAEQFSSNQSMFSLSQDTGLSTDVNTTEISSSFVSKQELGSTNNSSYDHQEGPSVVPISDIDDEGLWNF